MLIGLGVNNRRIAFVSFLGGIFLAYVMLRGPVKRRITRMALYAMPLVFVWCYASAVMVMIRIREARRAGKTAETPESAAKEDDRIQRHDVVTDGAL